MRRCWLMILPVVLWCAAAAGGEPANPTSGLSDWLSIPGFAVEAAVGTGVKDSGELEGQSTRFPENVGAVFCRVDGIGLEDAQTVTVVWFREGDERARVKLNLTKNKPRASTMTQIPAAQAGSWRVEVQNDAGHVLVLVPFVVGKPSANDEGPHKQAPPHH